MFKMNLEKNSKCREDLDPVTLGHLDPDRCMVFVCDLQAKLRNIIVHFDQVVEHTRKIVETAQVLGIPVIATEQLPEEVI